ncbi:hypothetical protein GJ744_010422 [Endocarpon pusillum]|uniref:Uncharacterized protein n=1 Tax=Endocarpon pusillum TaxID=364733 RepID=A0A8H7E5G9_9EURO|nr:hypothetical protein GJ744_010422 [Endocarpon pusillum]
MYRVRTNNETRQLWESLSGPAVSQPVEGGLFIQSFPPISSLATHSLTVGLVLQFVSTKSIFAMKSAIALALIGAAYTSAQVEYNNGSFVCAEPDANYCAGNSLSTNIIIRCTGTEGQPGNCNDNLAGIPPVGVKSSATCYQSSPSAGDAACSFNGIVYPEDGSEPFPVPSGGDDHSSAAETSSYGGSVTTVISQYTTGTVTNTYTVTVPCPTTTPSPEPPATTVSTTVTESSCYSDCPSSSAAPPTVAPPPSSPVETHPTPAPPATSKAPSPSSAPSAPYTPSEAPPAPPASSEAPPTPAPQHPPLPLQLHLNPLHQHHRY